MGETIKIRTDDMLMLAHALVNQLDGIREGKDVVTPFVFTPAVRWNLSKNAEILARAKKTFQQVLRGIFAQHGIIQGQPLDGPELQMKFALVKHDEAMQMEHEVEIAGLLFVGRDDLFNEREVPAADGRSKVKTRNEIPQSALTALLPILKAA